MYLLTLINLFFTIIFDPSKRILISDTLYLDNLNISKEELTNMVITKYKIPLTFETTEIYSDYFYSPSYNQIYSVELKVNYVDNPTIYNLKIIVQQNKNTQMSYNLFPIIFFILIIFILLLIYKKTIKNLK